MEKHNSMAEVVNAFLFAMYRMDERGPDQSHILVLVSGNKYLRAPTSCIVSTGKVSN